MSDRSRELPRRTCLSVPGSSVKMLAKAPSLPADMIFFDLEDSVAPAEKESARVQVAAAVRGSQWGERVICVRLNAWDTQHTVYDVLAVVEQAGPRLDAVMLPKVQSAAQVVALDLVLSQVEQRCGRAPGQIGIEAQIESARGMIAVEEICAASPRLETIIFGPADFAASMEMPVLTGGIELPDYPGDHFHYAFTKMLLAGRAQGLQVIDGPYLKIRDLDGLRAYSERTRLLGYDGKWVLHPDQIPVVNDVFSPTQEQFNRAWAVIDAYTAATTGSERRGAVMFDDEMIDEASRQMAIKFVRRGERAGLSRSEH